jgi:hypothetical protein
MAKEKEVKTSEVVSVADFLEKFPPGMYAIVQKLGYMPFASTDPRPTLLALAIELHCETDACDGPRFFEHSGKDVYLQAASMSSS